MSRSFTLGFISFLLLAGAMIGLRGGLIILSIPFVIFLLAGFIKTTEAIELSATRHLSMDRASPGQDVTMSVTITNHGGDLDDVLIEDVIPAGLMTRGEQNRHLIEIAKGSSFTLTYTLYGKRGGYEFENVQATVNDQFGITSRKVHIEAPGTLFIFPPLTRIRQVLIRPRRTKVYAGAIPARAGGSGTEFYGVRDYQSGDSPRTINWRASARTENTIYTNEFQQERVADVGIILDGRAVTNEFTRERSLFEHSVQAAAALADALLSQGNRVGLLLYGSFIGWTYPGYGKLQRERILRALAHAKVGGSEVFAGLDHIPTRLFPVQSQLVMISPLIAEDLPSLVRLRAQGYQVLLVSPDSVEFELSYLTPSQNVKNASRVVAMERKLLLQRVQHAGVQVLDWNVNDSFDQAVKRKLGRPPAWVRALAR